MAVNTDTALLHKPPADNAHKNGSVLEDETEHKKRWCLRAAPATTHTGRASSLPSNLPPTRDPKHGRDPHAAEDAGHSQPSVTVKRKPKRALQRNRGRC